MALVQTQSFPRTNTGSPGTVMPDDRDLRGFPTPLVPAENKMFIGTMTMLGPAVLVDSRGILASLRPAEPGSANPFEWGHRGTLTRELARAILLNVTGNPMLAERFCRPFTWEVVATLPQNGFRLPGARVARWVDFQATSLAAA